MNKNDIDKLVDAFTKSKNSEKILEYLRNNAPKNLTIGQAILHLNTTKRQELIKNL